MIFNQKQRGSLKPGKRRSLLVPSAGGKHRTFTKNNDHFQNHDEFYKVNSIIAIIVKCQKLFAEFLLGTHSNQCLYHFSFNLDQKNLIQQYLRYDSFCVKHMLSDLVSKMLSALLYLLLENKLASSRK